MYYAFRLRSSWLWLKRRLDGTRHDMQTVISAFCSTSADGTHIDGLVRKYLSVILPHLRVVDQSRKGVEGLMILFYYIRMER